MNVQIDVIDKKYFTVNKTENLSYDCLNAMIFYLQRKEPSNLFHLILNDTCKKHIGSYGPIPIYKHIIDSYLYVDVKTMKDLNIKKNLFKKINFTKTIYGREMLMKSMLYPFRNYIDIVNRHNDIATLFSRSVTSYLKQLKGIESDGTVNVHTLPVLLKTVIDINEVLKDTSLQFKDIDSIRALYKQINIFEGKELKNNLFSEYDQLVNLYIGLPKYLSEIAKNILSNKTININIIYIPQLGYLLEVDKDLDIEDFLLDIPNDFAQKKNRFQNNILEQSLFSVCDQKYDYSLYKQYFNLKVNDISQVMDEFVPSKFSENNLYFNKTTYNLIPCNKTEIEKYNTDTADFKAVKPNFVVDNKVYIKTKIMKLLDKELGDLSSLIEEYKFVKINEVREITKNYAFEDVFDYIGHVDLINSLKHFSMSNKCCVPKIIDKKEINLQNLWQYKGNIKICHNFIYKGSKKFLELIGEAIILFQMGSHIPAVTAEFYIFKQFYTSLNANDSILKNMSLFKASLKSIARLYHNACSESICLINNLGTGTAFEIGIMLFLEVHKKVRESIVVSACSNTEILDYLDHSKKSSIETDCYEKTKESINSCNEETVLSHNGCNLQDDNCICSFYYLKEIIIDQEIKIINYNAKKDDNSNSDTTTIPHNMSKYLIESLDIINKKKERSVVQEYNNWADTIIKDFVERHELNISPDFWDNEDLER